MSRQSQAEHMSQDMTQDCAFCRIVHAGLPPHGLYEDETAMVILDREALSYGHSLVISKHHVSQLHELPDDQYTRFFLVAKRLAPTLGRITGSPAVGYVAFGSGLPHAHLHLVPHSDPEVLLRPTDHLHALSDHELHERAANLRLAMLPLLNETTSP